jgi:integrase
VYTFARISPRKSGLLFCLDDAAKPDKLLDNFKSARDRAGYPSNLVIHSLRHTRNTRLSKVEPDIKNRMQILGQKTVSTNLRYTHVFDKDQLAVAKKLEKRAGDRSKNTPAQVVDFAKSCVINGANGRVAEWFKAPVLKTE